MRLEFSRLCLAVRQSWGVLCVSGEIWMTALEWFISISSLHTSLSTHRPTTLNARETLRRGKFKVNWSSPNSILSVYQLTKWNLFSRNRWQWACMSLVNKLSRKHKFIYVASPLSVASTLLLPSPDRPRAWRKSTTFGRAMILLFSSYRKFWRSKGSFNLHGNSTEWSGHHVIHHGSPITKITQPFKQFYYSGVCDPSLVFFIRFIFIVRQKRNIF